MTTTPTQQPPTPLEKMQLRTGACVVCDCTAFLFDVRQDGFPHCTCRHTQWGHRVA